VGFSFEKQNIVFPQHIFEVSTTQIWTVLNLGNWGLWVYIFKNSENQVLNNCIVEEKMDDHGWQFTPYHSKTGEQKKNVSTNW